MVAPWSNQEYCLTAEITPITTPINTAQISAKMTRRRVTPRLRLIWSQTGRFFAYTPVAVGAVAQPVGVALEERLVDPESTLLQCDLPGHRRLLGAQVLSGSPVFTTRMNATNEARNSRGIKPGSV